MEKLVTCIHFRSLSYSFETQKGLFLRSWHGLQTCLVLFKRWLTKCFYWVSTNQIPTKLWNQLTGGLKKLVKKCVSKILWECSRKFITSLLKYIRGYLDEFDIWLILSGTCQIVNFVQKVKSAKIGHFKTFGKVCKTC